MRTTRTTGRFDRDFRREQSGVLGKKLDGLLSDTIKMLAADKPLPSRYFDHALSGKWVDCRRRASSSATVGGYTIGSVGGGIFSRFLGADHCS